jgi:hypothetical protein
MPTVLTGPRYVRPFCRCSLAVFLSTLNGSKNKLVHVQSNIKWYQERWLHSTHNQGHIVSGRFTKFAVLSPLEHATISQHCQHYLASPWPISANTRATAEVTNTELAKLPCTIRTDCIVAVMRMGNVPSQKAKRLGIPKIVIGTP